MALRSWDRILRDRDFQSHLSSIRSSLRSLVGIVIRTLPADGNEQYLYEAHACREIVRVLVCWERPYWYENSVGVLSCPKTSPGETSLIAKRFLLKRWVVVSPLGELGLGMVVVISPPAREYEVHFSGE